MEGCYAAFILSCRAEDCSCTVSKAVGISYLISQSKDLMGRKKVSNLSLKLCSGEGAYVEGACKTRNILCSTVKGLLRTKTFLMLFS